MELGRLQTESVHATQTITVLIVGISVIRQPHALDMAYAPTKESARVTQVNCVADQCRLITFVDNYLHWLSVLLVVVYWQSIYKLLPLLEVHLGNPCVIFWYCQVL